MGQSTWGSFGFLFQSMIVALMSKKQGQFRKTIELMAEVNPAMASAWMMAWVLLLKLIIFNMFVAILVNSFKYVAKCTKHSRRIEKSVKEIDWQWYFRSKCMCLWKDPDTIEECEEQARKDKAWTKYLGL